MQKGAPTIHGIFTFNGNEVEHVQSYKYLGFEFHATKNLSHGISKLVSAAKSDHLQIDSELPLLAEKL